MKPMQAGDCYRNVFLYVKDNDLFDPGVKVVHGTVLSIATGARKRIRHAWIEYDGDVIDPTQGVTIDRRKFYKLVRAKPDVKYTPQEMVRMAVRTGHWGPWE
jgi:hypothetical protein